MHLQDFIRKFGPKEFAEAVGISLSYAYFLQSGYRTPSPKMAARIEKALKGKVKKEKMIDWDKR